MCFLAGVSPYITVGDSHDNHTVAKSAQSILEQKSRLPMRALHMKLLRIPQKMHFERQNLSVKVPLDANLVS